MSLLKVDASLHSHPAAIQAGQKAMGLWVLTLCWAAENSSDGLIPFEQVWQFNGNPYLARQLVGAKLWSWNVWEGGFRATQTIPWEICNEPSGQDLRKSYQGRKWRNAVYERDAYTCQVCGRDDRPIHAHHIKEWAKAPELRFDVSNGQTLCEVCHSEVHGRRLY